MRSRLFRRPSNWTQTKPATGAGPRHLSAYDAGACLATVLRSSHSRGIVYPLLFHCAHVAGPCRANLGSAYAALDRKDDAAAAFKRGLKLDPASVLLMENLAVLGDGYVLSDEDQQALASAFDEKAAAEGKQLLLKFTPVFPGSAFASHKTVKRCADSVLVLPVCLCTRMLTPPAFVRVRALADAARKARAARRKMFLSGSVLDKKASPAASSSSSASVSSSSAAAAASSTQAKATAGKSAAVTKTTTKMGAEGAESAPSSHADLPEKPQGKRFIKEGIAFAQVRKSIRWRT